MSPENGKLAAFIDHARQKGMDLSSVLLLLRASGWKEKEIAEALAARELGIPLPERAGVGSARDAFLHLLAFMAMYASVITLICLVFNYVDLALPDAVMRQSTYEAETSQTGMRVSLATLIVAFPLFILVWWYLLHDIWFYPEKAKSQVRRWLSCLSLFVGAVTILSDLITLVYYLVDGDLTLRFLLKVIVLFLIAGTLFIYIAMTLHFEAEASQ